MAIQLTDCSLSRAHGLSNRFNSVSSPDCAVDAQNLSLVSSPPGETHINIHMNSTNFMDCFKTIYRSVWRRQWHPTPVLLPGKSHGRRSLVGCSPWGCQESDTTERLDFHFSLSCIGEGNGSPLQCSCLENPRDGGAWLAAVYGVTQSQTRLKRLSSSLAAA